MMQNVILINPFEVPAGEEEQFLKAWHEVGEYMRRVPGFRSTRLHQSLDPQAKFRFINVVQWESAQHFQAAINAEEFRRLVTDLPFTAYPALYQVIVE